MNTELQLADLARRVANMMRTGRIAEVDHAGPRVRVQSGDLLTEWLPWQTHRAGNTRTWDPPTVGEQVMILSPSGEPAAGMVIPAFYCQDHLPPSNSPNTHVTEYPDGARISYNHATGALVASGIQTGTIQAAVSVTLDTPLTHCTGKLTVDDLLTYGNGISGTGGDNNNTINGKLTHVGGELSSNGIVLHTHTHPGDSGGTTGVPQ
jgi:phage baseplate assembly protein V